MTMQNLLDFAQTGCMVYLAIKMFDIRNNLEWQIRQMKSDMGGNK